MTSSSQIPYDFQEADLELLQTLLDFLDPRNQISDGKIQKLRESVFIDYSFQGWTVESLEDREIQIADDILRDLEGQRPWENAVSRGILYLGLYYSTEPRKIILFPNAIKLVAGSMRFKAKLSGGSDSDKCLEHLLTKVVLIHEIAHWFTLVPNKHGSRLALLQPAFKEIAETLAELLSWVTFNLHYNVSSELGTDLLRVQYLTNDPAGGYEYQLYWFWLVLTGLGSERKYLQGAYCPDIGSTQFKERLDAISTWASCDEVEPRILLIRIAKSGNNLSTLLRQLPGFEHPSTALCGQLWKLCNQYTAKIENLRLKIVDDDELFDVWEI